MRFIRNTAAFFALPGVLACAYGLCKVFLSFTGSSGTQYIPFWLGIFCYCVFQVIFYKPMRTYVFGHELTHAVAGVLSGAKIKKFKVGKESGSVTLSKDNVWITLAPYFFPIYTFAIILVYIFLGWFADIRQFYPYFLFLIGISIAFHIALTVYIVSIDQPDLKVYGVFFSYVLILFINVIVFALLAALAFPNEISVSEVFGEMYESVVAVYVFLLSGIKEIFTAFTSAS